MYRCKRRRQNRTHSRANQCKQERFELFTGPRFAFGSAAPPGGDAAETWGYWPTGMPLREA
jgi:hypothetical protein